MKSIQDGQYIFARFFPDENILESIIELCKRYQVRTGIVFSGIGQLKNITLGYFLEKGNYLPQDFDEVYELLSLNGSIINQNNEFIPHLHCVIGDKNKHVFGGHLINGTVEVTNEIVLLSTSLEAYRNKSEKTGLLELDF
jgi:predicted DNA-binding protein with PD1-like motif